MKKNWQKLVNESQMNRNVRTRRGGLSFGITKSGSMTISAALRERIRDADPEFTHARPGFHQGEKIVMVEFLKGGKTEGARKISHMGQGRGTSSLAVKSFLNQVGLDVKKVSGRYPAKPIEELDGEWWYFKIK